MMRAQPDLLADRLQRRRAVRMLGDILAGALDQLDLWLVRAGLAWVAALAWPEAGLLGRLGYAEEDHLVAPRSPRGAGRPAVDPGRAHCIDELPIRAGVPGLHSLPIALFVHGLCLRLLTAKCAER